MSDTSLSLAEVTRLTSAVGLGFADAVNLHSAISQAAGALPVFSATSYGAAGDGTTDDRAALQAAIDACAAAGGGQVTIPNGTYSLTQGAGFYCLLVPGGVELIGESREGVILKQAAGIAASVRLLYLEGVGPRVTRLTLDGNKANNSVQEHRHGIFVNGATHARVDGVTAQNFTGDGFYLYDSADYSLWIDCESTGNERNGFTFGGAGQANTNILGGRFHDSAVQQIDSEAGGPVTNVLLVGVTVDPGSSDDYVLTVSGTSRTTRSRSWAVVGCVLNGPVNVVWADDITFIGCHGTSANTGKPHLRVYRKCVGVHSVGSSWKSTANTAGDKMVVNIEGTDNTNGDRASQITFSGGTIENTQGQGFGLYLSAAEDVTVNGTVVIGAGANEPGYWGVYARTTLASFPVRAYTINGAHIKNFGSGAIAFAGSGAAEILAATVAGCTFDSDVASVMPYGVDFDTDSSGAVKKATYSANTATGNVTTPLVDYPGDGVLCVSGGYGTPGSSYSSSASPEGVIAAPIGSLATSRTTGLLYSKTSGTGNTGWALV